MPTIIERIQHGWNAFVNGEKSNFVNHGMTYSYRPDRIKLTGGNAKSIVSTIYNRIAVDISMIDIKHVQRDEQDRYIGTIDSPLNNTLTMEANLDQTARAFIVDLVESLFDEGTVAVIPVEKDYVDNKKKKNRIQEAMDIYSLRTAKVVAWYPKHVRVRAYNELTGQHQEITLPKSDVAIIENPFYTIMNEHNSTAKRLVRKLNLLDIMDEQNSSGKLDLILQLPYTIKTEARRKHADERRQQLEQQLAGSKYGIAYTDGTEKVVQLNRPIENQLLKQVELLTQQLYGQLGVTQSIIDGTANEQTMLNYYNHTIEPVLAAITDEFRRKFLTKSARDNKETIAYFRDPFRLVPINNLADIADRFTRNEIMSSNEVRSIIGLMPDDNPRSDELINKNINHSEDSQDEWTEEDLEDFE